MLRGKSPCLGAESASGRPQGSCQTSSGDASRGALVAGSGPSQQHRHAVSAHDWSANRTGLTLLMPPPMKAWCLAQLSWRHRLDILQLWMRVVCECFCTVLTDATRL
mmetsp:Transcript_16809/g.44238  ORF Transcript_16809/g.44238 Transcript_16809/m.44238 type:complete len:107 (-) Transcript_16809:17-337(-)